MKKKLFATILSVILAVTMMPLSAFADTNEVAKEEADGPAYGTHEYWEKLYPKHIHTESLEPGETLVEGTPSGTLFIDKDITVNATEAGQSGLSIYGNVTIIIEDGHTLTIKGADADYMIGAGAGIELLEGNSLHVKGTGKLDVKGGKGGDIGIGKSGEDGIALNSGDGGAGGNGGGGAGAAIGSSGSDGGAGGQAVDGRHEGTSFKNYDAHAGKNGEDSKNVQNVGKFCVSGDIKLILKGGEKGECPNELEVSDGKNHYRNGWLFHCFNMQYGGGGAGGYGGVGRSGAKIGSGGPGGAGGGGGSSGSIHCYSEKVSSSSVCYSNGVAGVSDMAREDAAYENCKRVCYDSFRSSDTTYKRPLLSVEHGLHGATSGNCGKVGSYGYVPTVYATTLDEFEGSGPEASIRKVYPVDECEIKVVDRDFQLVHIPTGTVFEKDKDFSVEIEKSGNDFDVIASSDKLVDSTMEKEEKLHSIFKSTSYNVRHHLQKLTSDGTGAADTYDVFAEEVFQGIAGTVTDVNPLKMKGFTGRHVYQEPIKEDGSTKIDIFYDRDVNTVTLKKGTHSSSVKDKYKMSLCYGANIEKNLPEGYELAEEGYKFAGWSPAINADTVMDDEDIEFEAQWDKLPLVNYTERIYIQNLSSDEKQVTDTYSLLSEKTKQGHAGEMTEVHPETEGLHAKPFEQKVIQEDGQTVVEVYMDRDAYDINVTFAGGSAICQEFGVASKTFPLKIYYGASIGKNLPENFYKAVGGYRFIGFAPTLNPSEKASPKTITDKDYLAIFSGAY